MPRKTPLLLRSRELKVEVDPRDLAVAVTVAATGETLRMAGAQDDDVLMAGAGGAAWKSFAGTPVTCRKASARRIDARLPGLGLKVRIELDGPDVVFEVAPAGRKTRRRPCDVLYPRHFVLPRRRGAYATFPLGAGSIIPADWPGVFHHREGYSEPVASWLGGWTGRTGYCAVAETPDDLYQAVHHAGGEPASCFFHWLGSLGELRYARRARYTFAKDFGYVAQAKHFRAHCRRAGLFRSLAEKAEANPNVDMLRGGAIICTGSAFRRERNFEYGFTTFADQAAAIERFRRRTGVSKAIVHVDGWGYWGYDAMHPDVLPPNADCGGVAGLSDLARRVKKLGYLFGLHDQYIDYYAHAPSFDEGKSIVLPDGRPVRVNRWCGGLCGHLCYHFIPDFVRRNFHEGVRRVYPMYHNSPPIREICRPTAYYIDCFLRTVECRSEAHPMTRTEARERMGEACRIVRDGAEGEPVVMSVEHPRDFGVPYLDFGWSLGHLSADVPNTEGVYETRVVGLPVPLWHLAFHDAVAVPSPRGDLIEALLYAQAPYFWPGRKALPAGGLAARKVLLALHADAGFAEMTGFELLASDGSAARSTFDGGLTVEVERPARRYRISDGGAKTRGWRKLP